MRKYLILTTGLSVVFIILYFLGEDGIIPLQLHTKFPALVIFFFLQSVIVSWIFYQAEKDEWKNPIYALGAIAFRLLTGMFFLVILVLLQLEEIKSLMIQFIVLYLVYLIFELFAVLPNLRRN